MKNLLFLISIVLILSGCKKKYELQVSLSPSDGGIVSPESGKYEEGEQVTIRLSPNSDYKFIQWTGDWVGNENPITITMDRDYSIVGNLETPIYLDENGVTIKCRDWCMVGESYEFNGKTYTIVDRAMLDLIIHEGKESDLTKYCTSKILDMSKLAWQIPFNGDVSNWDVSNVTDMGGMFSNSPFNGDISNWDVSNVTDMGGMFGSSPFNGDISNWDVSNVTDMRSMFWGDSIYNQDLSNWDVMNVIMCGDFMRHNNVWTLPRPNFTNCDCGCN